MAWLPTRRLLALALAAALPLAAVTYWPPALVLAGLYLLILTVGVVRDARALPPADAFTVTRTHEPRLSLGEPNPVDVAVRWHGQTAGRPLAIRVRDVPPPTIPADQAILGGRIAPGGDWRATYNLHPPRRGDYAFGDTTVRLTSPLGLLVRQRTYPTAAPVRVYPNLRAIRRYELIAHRGQMLEAGRRRQRYYGRGTEFERLRDYQPDDDYRRIAWNATARRRQPVVVEHEAERSQNLVVVLDCGRLMATPIGPLRKLDYAVDATMLLAYVATKMGDRVGLLAFADRVTRYAPPARGRGQFNALLETLYAVEAQPVESDPARALAYLAGRQAKRSLVVLFSDLAETLEAEAIVAQLGYLARHHLPICASLGDPDVAELAAAVPADLAAAYEKVVAARLVEERRGAITRLERSGVLTLDVPADRLAGALVDRYVEIKRRTML